MSKPVMVGESPSASGDRYWRWPLSGAPARVLCLCAGWEPEGPASELGSWTWALYGRFQTTNLFARHAAAVPWANDKARERAQAIAARAVRQAIVDGEHARLVLLGRRVATAFGLDLLAYFQQAPLQTLDGIATAVVVPHPSGRNLLMNDPLIREQTGIALRIAAGEER